MPVATVRNASARPNFLLGVGTVVLGAAVMALSLQTILSSVETAKAFFSPASWQRLVASLGATPSASSPDGGLVDLAYIPVFLATLAVATALWLLGGLWITVRRRLPIRDALSVWGSRGWLWWLLPGLWEAARLASFTAGWEGLQLLLLSLPNMLYSLTLGGWMATGILLARRRPEAAAENRSIPAGVWIAMAVYALVYIAMNWQLWENLRIPHGDSAMYEEHLWNLTHGKGFRSYLDQGLFLGEHVQVIHLVLLPLHLLWPSHLLLEVAQSIILAAGAIPVFWMARRHSGSRTAAALLATAYLLYFPMQFLDIAIDLKTFRPTAFGITTLLFALDQLERRRIGTAVALLLVTLTAQEDFAIAIAPVGAWITLRGVALFGTGAEESRWSAKRVRILGAILAAGSVAYLLLATRVIIPWFRSGAELHYVGYYSKFGKSFGEVASNILLNPPLLFGELLDTPTAIYALALLLPVGFLPLLSPGRMAAGLPLFVLLCLNEIAASPQHHFHAPVIPIIFWAAAAGLANVPHVFGWLRLELGQTNNEPAMRCIEAAGVFAITCALASNVFFSLNPLGITFWDPGSAWRWRALYVPNERAQQFPKVAVLIPEDSRVASTDFVHPRFTHHERSYDYSDYRRRVSGYELTVPADTDYIVIDTQHPYSRIKEPGQIREYVEHPDQWELLPDETGGYYIVLKRRAAE